MLAVNLFPLFLIICEKSIRAIKNVSIQPYPNLENKNIFASGELAEDSVCRKFRQTAADGKNYQVKYYNLDAVISVGYRVIQDRLFQSDFDRLVDGEGFLDGERY